MPIEDPRYDIAISFLSRDESIAAAITQKLSEGMQVFFFPRCQEELAGTDGLESMRTPFLDDSRVMLVLFREPWGKTNWTRVEETAIKDACLAHGFQRLFFVVLDQASTLPIWLPQTQVRFNYAEYGLEQAVGAIKARVQENGGKNHPLTAMKRAEMYKADELFRLDKSRMSSEEGITAILNNVDLLFRHLKKRCDDITAQGHLEIRCSTEFNRRNPTQGCVMTDDHVGMIVNWYQQYSNSLTDSTLTVREYGNRLILHGEVGISYTRHFEHIRETKYSPDLSLAREYGWKRDRVAGFLSSSDLAEQSVIQFVDLASRNALGNISGRRPLRSSPRSSW
jgi:hypothetical protein